MYLEEQTYKEIQNVQLMLETSSQITKLMHEIQQRQQEYDLLDFVKRQRMIMNEELICDKIPFVKSNIHKFNTNISEKLLRIEEMKSKIVEIKDTAQIKKRRNQQLYNKKRMLTQECKAIENQIQKLNSKSKENSKRNSLNLVVQSFVKDEKYKNNGNKQNQNRQNGMNEQNNHVNASHLQVLDLVNVRTKNILLMQKIQKAKQQVQKKMQQALALERECKDMQIPFLKSSGSRDKITKPHPGAGRSGSVTKSEFISIQQSGNSSLRS